MDCPFTDQVAHRGEPATAEDGVVRAALQGEVFLSFLADDRDRAQPEGPPELDRGGSDASRGAMHQRGVPRLRVYPPGQREQCGQVVQGAAAPASKLMPSGNGSTLAGGTDTTSCQHP